MRMTGGRAVLRQPHHLHRQHHHARQRHPPRDAAGRRRRVQHRGAQVQRPAAQPARVLQEPRRAGRPGHRRPEDAQREERGRRHAEAGGAEPQPADLRRRRVAVRGLLRPAVVPDRQLPRPRRVAHAVAAGRARAPRTTSWRSPSRSCSTATSPAAFDVFKRTLRYIDQFTQESTGGNLSFGFPVADFSRMFFTYSYEQVQVSDLNPFYYNPASCWRRTRSCGLAADRRGRQAHDQQGRRRASSTTPSTTRSSRRRGRRITARSISPASAATPTSSSRASRRCSSGTVTAPDVVRLARPVRVHPAVRQHQRAADLREAVPRRRVQRPRLRHPLDRPARSAHRPGAGRQQEPAVQRRVHDLDCRAGAADPVLRRRPGRASAASRSRWTEDISSRSIPPPAPILTDPFSHGHPRRIPNAPGPTTEVVGTGACVQDLDRRGGPVLHAGAERAVPVDLRASTRRAAGVSTTTCSRPSSSSSASPSARPSSGAYQRFL